MLRQLAGLAADHRDEQKAKRHEQEAWEARRQPRDPDPDQVNTHENTSNVSSDEEYANKLLREDIHTILFLYLRVLLSY